MGKMSAMHGVLKRMPSESILALGTTGIVVVAGRLRHEGPEGSAHYSCELRSYILSPGPVLACAAAAGSLPLSGHCGQEWRGAARTLGSLMLSSAGSSSEMDSRQVAYRARGNAWQESCARTAFCSIASEPTPFACRRSNDFVVEYRTH